jgi:uncharacterized protein YfaS (alpha-2-macroglobulin family)
VLWKQVDDAISRGLPRTAAATLDQIIPGALQDQAYAEACKAICLKIVYETQVDGTAEQRIARLQAQIATLPEQTRPVLEAILGHWYWSYFQQNRWRIMQRTTTAEPPGEDISTWDLATILAEIDKHFTAALSQDPLLKATPVSQFNDLLEQGTVPDIYRPTLYDFLAFDALSFYGAGEQAGAKPQDAYDLTADSPIFGSVEDFIQWRPQTTDTRSATLKAVGLYQSLLTFHQSDPDKTAFLDADLHRLEFGYSQAVGPDKVDRYVAALERFVDQWIGHESAARALFDWALVLNQQGDPLKAHQLAQQGWNAFPKSYGGASCYNLIQQIEAKSVSIQTEAVWNDPLPQIQVTYRNIDRVFFRAVAVDFKGYGRPAGWWVSDAKVKELLALPPALAWSADLAVTSDYRQRTEALPGRAGLAPGFYVLIASHDPSFGPANNQVIATQIWVSDLALVIRTRTSGPVGGFVLNAKSGEPLEGATVTCWPWNSNKGQYVPGDAVKSDANGLFQIRTGSDFLVTAEYHGQMLASTSSFGVYSGGTTAGPYEQTVFFTDRSLYRPGQTIRYKGICIRSDPANASYLTLAARGLTVAFRDVNGKEISRQQHTCNDYGSFSGSFTAPQDRALGTMTLQVEAGPTGGTSVNVEQYKRPTFVVALDAPADAPRLGSEVVIPGKATAYTGVAIAGAQVKWRVVRQARFPIWCWWSRGYGASATSQAIAYGSAVTEPDGTFAIRFTARPDLSIPEADEPTFSFQVSADVTDTTGETRSQVRSVSAGYTALQAAISASDWQTLQVPVELTITTTSIDGDPESGQGTLKVYGLRQPDRVMRPGLASTLSSSAGDASDPETWELGNQILEAAWQTDAMGQARLSVSLGSGIYRAVLATQDRFGKPVTATLTFKVVDPAAKTYGIKVANAFASPAWSVEPGGTFLGLWGTGYDRGRAYLEIECRGQVLEARWTDPNLTQVVFDLPVTEQMRGGFTVRVTTVRENRAYLNERVVDVPWTNKQLTLRWEHFRSRIEPGQKETWTAVITGPGAAKAVAEMVAGMYDASLDQYLPHSWLQGFNVFRKEASEVVSRFQNQACMFQWVLGAWPTDSLSVSWEYRHFPMEILGYWPVATAGPSRGGTDAGAAADNSAAKGEGTGTSDSSTVASSPDLSQVEARKNLDETAFFYPHLMSGSDGVVRIEFTMPESLTQWRFMGFAHDRQLRSGFLGDTVVTAKDLMVQPNPPRFVREGDVVEFTVKVSNQSATRQAGKVGLTLSDAWTQASRDVALGNTVPEQSFDLASQESRTFSWRLTIPDECGILTYRAVAANDRLSDGQEAYLPVLSRRILVTESLPLPVRGPQTRQFEFTKLLESGQSNTLVHQSMTVQMVSQPAWYAVMALPYLMEHPYECSEQVFNRYYANSLARYIASSDPKIRQVFDLWKATPALDSPLEKDEDLKAVALEQTPWVRQAEAESQARRNVGILFDENRLSDEMGRVLYKLGQMQGADGLWPWLPGCKGSEYITLYIVTGFGRLRHLGVHEVDVSLAIKALAGLDKWVDDQYKEIAAHGDKDQNHLTCTIALYLYGRSFFLAECPIDAKYQEAVNYWLDQGRRYWLSLWRQSQAHLAIGLKRFGDKQTPVQIMASIKEFSSTSEEMGMTWQDTERTWWWYKAPIETQAMMIEAFDEVTNDSQAVEDCKVWLLKQKQTQDWRTTKATADAIYGLLIRGTNLLASNSLVLVALNGQWIQPDQIEAGTGFYEKRFAASEIQPSMGHVTVKKTDEGVSWGSVHWQYLEDMSKVTGYEGTPLQLRKALYVKTTTGQGQVLTPVTGALHVGDELVTRIELRVDRDMEYVHMEDQRASGTEPVSVLSGYRYQDGLAYYQSVHDTSTHFYMDYLAKGVYVFEYSTRVQLKGRYQSGVTDIQCMYAPEFNSHSESVELEVE